MQLIGDNNNDGGRFFLSSIFFAFPTIIVLFENIRVVTLLAHGVDDGNMVRSKKRRVKTGYYSGFLRTDFTRRRKSIEQRALCQGELNINGYIPE